MRRWRGVNTAERYGQVAILLHWLSAALVIALLGMGLYMTALPDGDAKWDWYDLHKSIGTTVLVVALFRIGWRARGIVPPAPTGLTAAEHLLAKGMHLLLYVLMLILPISGYLDSSAGGYHLGWFGFFEIPMLIPKNETLFEIALAVHRWGAYLLIGALALHLAGILKHQLVLKDGLLRRMLPGND